MKIVTAAIVSILSCAAAHADVYEFHFETELTECLDTDICSSDAFLDWQRVPRTASGLIVIDESRLPGGSLAGATLSFFQNPLDEWYWDGIQFYEPVIRSYEVSGPRGDFTGTWRQENFGPWVGAPFLTDYSGYLEGFLTWTVGPSELTLSFDYGRNVVSWYGDSYNYGDVGGDSMFWDGQRGSDWNADFFAYQYGAASRDPGTWTRTRLDVTPPPSPVPVPAAGALLAGALAGLGLAAKRRRARPRLG